jgi:hypothetical protein
LVRALSPVRQKERKHKRANFETRTRDIQFSFLVNRVVMVVRVVGIKNFFPFAFRPDVEYQRLITHMKRYIRRGAKSQLLPHSHGN